VYWETLPDMVRAALASVPIDDATIGPPYDPMEEKPDTN
jgi:hypothetical protein